MKIDPNDPVVETAVFGRQVEQFLGTDIGRYLVARAEQDVEESVEQLKKVAWFRGRKIRQLQNRIAVAESVQQWLGDAIREGHSAMNVIEDHG